MLCVRARRKEHTDYKAGYSANHQVIRWFWAIVETLSPEQRWVLDSVLVFIW